MKINRDIIPKEEGRNSIAMLVILCFGFGIFVFVMVYFFDVVHHRGSIQYAMLLGGVAYFTSTLVDLLRKVEACRSASVPAVVSAGEFVSILRPCFRVNKIRWAAGNIQYALIFYEDRLLFAKIGGQWATTKTDVPDPGDELRAQKMVSMSKLPSHAVLKLGKKNFEILYKDISRIKLKKSSIGVNGAREGVLQIKSKRKVKLDIAPEENYDRCQNIVLKFLGDKVKNNL